MITKQSIHEMLEDMADAAVQIEHEQIAEMKDSPDQWQGLSQQELELLLRLYPRMVDPDIKKNPHWDTHSVSGRNKLNLITKIPPEITGIETSNADDLLPYNILISDEAPVEVNENECPHTARMQNAVNNSQDIELELSDGSTVSLDPHTLQMIINKKKCVDIYRHLSGVDSFRTFLGGVYDRSETHDHSGYGHQSDTGSDVGGGE